MKRKLLNVALLTMALGGAATFTSCNDMEENITSEWNQNIEQLQAQIDKLKAAQDQCKADCDKKIKDLIDATNAINKSIEQTNANVDAANKRIDETNIDLAATKLALQNTNEELAQTKASLEQSIKDITALKANLETLENRIAVLEAFKTEMETFKSQMEGFKGDMEEFKAQTEEKQKVYDAKIKAFETEVANISTLLTTIQNNIQNNTTAIQNLQKTSEDLKAAVEANKAAIANNSAAIGNNAAAISANTSAINANAEAIAANLAAIANNLKLIQLNQEAISGLQNSVSDINTTLASYNTRLSATEATAASALATAAANQKAIEELQNVIEALKAKDTELGSLISELEKKFDGQIQKLSDEYAALAQRMGAAEDVITAQGNRISGLEAIVATLAKQADLDALVERVAKCEEDILALKGDVNTLFGIYDRLNSLITGITVQRVTNPVFGNIALPTGFQTNVLFNYYGQYAGVKNLVFPSNRQVEGLDGMLSAEDMKVLSGSFEPTTIEPGDWLVDDAGLGRVYLTINPNNIDFTGGQLSLETSAGRNCGVELRNVRPCTEELKFGMTRGGNGFYTADAYLPATAEAINKTKFDIQPGLRTAVRELVKDRKPQAILSLLNNLNTQLTHNLPAFGVKASWTANDGKGNKEYAVLSKYDIAATCVHPLSYNTFAGESFNSDKFVPNISPIANVKAWLDANFDSKKYHFSFNGTGVSIKNVDITFPEMTLTVNGEYIEVVAPGVEVDVTVKDEDGKVSTGKGMTDPIKVTITPDDLKPFTDKLQENLNKEFANTSAEMRKAVADAVNDMIGSVKKQVADMVKDMEGQINDKFDQVFNDLKNMAGGKLQAVVDNVNNLIERYNQVANKINYILKNPNNYLQVTMLYNGGSGLHHLSNSAASPTVFVQGSGDAITLYPTSYTAEIAAPAYKKFVAVTNVTNAAGQSAKKGDATLLSELKSINAKGGLCEVLPGRVKRLGISTANMKKGNVYEIVYTAVDYAGYTSTQHFYLKIK